MEEKKKKKRIVNRLAPIFAVALILVTLLSTSVSATNGAQSPYNQSLTSCTPLSHILVENPLGFSLTQYSSDVDVLVSPFDMLLYDYGTFGDTPLSSYLYTLLFQYPFENGTGTRPFHLNVMYRKLPPDFDQFNQLIFTTDTFSPEGSGSTNRNIFNARRINLFYEDFCLVPSIDGKEDFYINMRTEIKQEALTSAPYNRVEVFSKVSVPIMVNNVCTGYEIFDYSYSRISNNSISNNYGYRFSRSHIVEYADSIGITIPSDVGILCSDTYMVVEPFLNANLDAITPSTSYFCREGEYSCSVQPYDDIYSPSDFIEEYPVQRTKVEFMSDSNFFANITTAVASFFNTDLFGDFSIGDLLLVSVGFGVLMFIIKMFRG